jgi:hypothetical protein
MVNVKLRRSSYLVYWFVTPNRSGEVVSLSPERCFLGYLTSFDFQLCGLSKEEIQSNPIQPDPYTPFLQK